MIGKQEDMALRSATGLEGGLVARGSTCGVVTGGALGIALMRIEELDKGGEAAQLAVMKEAREYVDWFQRGFKTTLCRERTSVDFYKTLGQLRYFLPNAVGRCMWHTGKATSYLNSLSTSPLKVSIKNTTNLNPETIHCATNVLTGVRESCGVGNDIVEKIAFVLDGGVALSGGLCGAMAGAVMAANLVFGWDIRKMSYPATIKEFVRGHVNLLRKHTSEKPETFAIGKDIMNRLRGMEASLECSHITGKTFSSRDDFQAHMRSSSPCQSLIKEAVKVACEAITHALPL
jgi:hypothetical protein